MTPPAGGHFGVARGYSETILAGFYRIRVPVAAGAGEVHRAAGGQLVQIAIGAILHEVHAFGLGDGGQVHLHAGGGNGLSGDHARSRRGSLQKIVITAEGDKGCEQQSNHAHNISIIAWYGRNLGRSKRACGEFVTGANLARYATIVGD